MAKLSQESQASGPMDAVGAERGWGEARGSKVYGHFLPAAPPLASPEMTGLDSLIHTVQCQTGSLVPLSSFSSIKTQGQP